MSEIKLCECGCGNPAPIAPKTDNTYGWIKGHPKRFIRGHATRRHYPSLCEHEPKHLKGLCQHCYSRAYRAVNQAKIKERKAAYRTAKRNDINAQNRAYAIAHPDKKASWGRRYRSANPEKLAAQKHKRRARERGNGGSWTAKQWLVLLMQFQYRCACCWKTESELKVLGRVLARGHVQSLRHGGLNHITNIVPLCHGKGGCNNRIGSRHVMTAIS